MLGEQALPAACLETRGSVAGHPGAGTGCRSRRGRVIVGQACGPRGVCSSPQDQELQGAERCAVSWVLPPASSFLVEILALGPHSLHPCSYSTSTTALQSSQASGSPADAGRGYRAQLPFRCGPLGMTGDRVPRGQRGVWERGRAGAQNGSVPSGTGWLDGGSSQWQRVTRGRASLRVQTVGAITVQGVVLEWTL